MNPTPSNTRRMLITAGPTQEPIDAVRYIGNRSSGRVGVEIADAAIAAGWNVTLLLGPTSLTPKSSQVRVLRFRTGTDLEHLLTRHFPETDVLVMAAAVADFRPKPGTTRPGGKLKREDRGLTLELESTPDLLAQCARSRRKGQTLIGFALEAGDVLAVEAPAKLARKGIDLIVANPLETMDAPTIQATVFGPHGVVARTPGSMAKSDFAPWLLNVIQSNSHAPSTPAAAAAP